MSDVSSSTADSLERHGEPTGGGMHISFIAFSILIYNVPH